jgi:hypothetical protein
MRDFKKQYCDVTYPVKIGLSDGSGVDENWISDANGNSVVHGWGDCCKIGGIQEKEIAEAIVKSLNKTKPRFKVSFYVYEEKKEENEIH